MAHSKHKITKDNVIHNLAELDQFMFSTLRFTRKDIESIK
jgi:hypothetical protein